MIFKNKFTASSKYDFVIVGLGNPGSKYEMTRHNAGFLAMDLLAVELSVDFKKLKYHALVCDAVIDGKKCLLMKPQTMMNNSGQAVGEVARFYKIPSEKILVIYDDISLDVGSIRIRRKGTAGGHNGIKSIISSLSSEEFPRIKIGVGKKPAPDYDLVDWVLGKFPKDKEPQLKSALENATSALRLIITDQTEKAMNKYN